MVSAIKEPATMNQRHLGDALDHWKGSVIASLGAWLRDVHVIPMFTDKTPVVSWSEAHLRLYARLLRVSRDRIMYAQTPFRASNRDDYFSALRLPADTDAFLDPDNGVAPGSGGDARHVRPNELATLLPADSRRIVLVYQHSFRTNDYVQASLRRVADSPRLAGAAAFAYDAGAAAMIFASRSRPRLIEVHTAMARMLEGTSRITQLHGAPPSVP